MKTIINLKTDRKELEQLLGSVEIDIKNGKNLSRYISTRDELKKYLEFIKG